MSISRPSSVEAAGAPSYAEAREERIRALQARISHMQRIEVEAGALPVLPALTGVLPHGGLRRGATYSVPASMMLVMGLIAAPSAAGAWCAVVGVPEFGVEAASHLGIDLRRLVLIPRPGPHVDAVTAALIDVMQIVVVGSWPRAGAEHDRMTARLRQRGGVVIAAGFSLPGSVVLAVRDGTWEGIGRGHGYPRARRMTIEARQAGGKPRRTRVWLPDREGRIRAMDDDRMTPLPWSSSRERSRAV